MVERSRRSVLAIGTAAATGGLLASVGTTGADDGCCQSVATGSDGWSSYRGNTSNTAFVETDAFPELDDVAWEYEETGSVAAVDGGVFLRTDDGDVHALNAETGDLEWKLEDLDAVGTPAVEGETVYVSGERLTAIDGGTGDVLWEMAFDEDDGASPTVADGTVYVAAGGSLYAVDAEDGSLAWNHDRIELEVYDEETGEGETAERPFATQPVTVDDDTVYAPVSPSGFVALDAATGDTLWTADLIRGGDLVIPTDDGVYVSGFEGGHRQSESHLAEYDGEPEPIGPTRLQKYVPRFGTSSEAFATSGEVRLITAAEGRRLEAWDVEREAFRWAYDDLGELGLFRAPVIAGDTAIVSYHPPSMAEDEQNNEEARTFGAEPAILGLDLENGSPKWVLPHEAVGDVDDPLSDGELPYAVSDDTLYVSTDTLVAVRSSEDIPTDDGEADDESGDDGATDGDTTTDDTDSEADRDSDEPDTGLETDAPENDSQTDTENESEPDGGTDEAPGFTTGAGLVGGGLTLEWLRRRATTDESAE